MAYNLRGRCTNYQGHEERWQALVGSPDRQWTSTVTELVEQDWTPSTPDTVRTLGELEDGMTREAAQKNERDQGKELAELAMTTATPLPMNGGGQMQVIEEEGHRDDQMQGVDVDYKPDNSIQRYGEYRDPHHDSTEG